MNNATGSTDRVLALSFLQQAVDTVAVDAEINTTSTQTISLVQGTQSYTLGVSPFNQASFIAIDMITLTDTALSNVPLEQVSMQEMRTRIQGAGQAQASPNVYAVEYPNIFFYPNPGPSTTINLSYATTSVTLLDDLTTALTFIPSAFLWGCIAEYATALAFRYKKQTDWQAYMTQYKTDTVNGLPGLKRWIGRVGGMQRPGAAEYQLRLSSPSQDSWSMD